MDSRSASSPPAGTQAFWLLPLCGSTISAPVTFYDQVSKWHGTAYILNQSVPKISPNLAKKKKNHPTPSTCWNKWKELNISLCRKGPFEEEMKLAMMETTSSSQPIPAQLDYHRASKLLDEGQHQKSHMDSPSETGLDTTWHPSTEPPLCLALS